MEVMPKLIKWISLDTLEKGNYVEADWNQKHYDVLIKTLVDNKYVICGDTHQCKAIPVFDDGYIMLSMRKWDEVMDDAAMLMDPWTYARTLPSFYMACSCSVKEKVPLCE